MSKSIMIAVSYRRVPKTELYESEIEVRVLIVEEGAKSKEEPLMRSMQLGVRMEELIATLHQVLQTYPKAVVTMIRGTTRPTHYGQKPPRGFELDMVMRDLIRDDLHKAQKAFAPVERAVKVKE